MTEAAFPPLANADEWQRRMVRDVVGVVHAHVAAEHGHPTVKIVAPGAIAQFDRAEALVPLINAALPLESPHRFAIADVVAITNVAQGYRDPEYVDGAQRAAAKILALLPEAHDGPVQA